MTLLKVQFIFAMLWTVYFLSGCVPQTPRIELTPEQIAAKAQKRAEIHTELASVYYSRRQFRVALEEVNDALKANVNYAPAYNVLGLIHMTLNEDQLAQQNFERALTITPTDSEAHNNYGWYLCQRVSARMDEAIKHFMVAVRDPLYKTPEKSYTNAGICEMRRGQYKGAADFFHNALLINAKYIPALVGTMELDMRNNKIELAKSKLSRHMRQYDLTPESLWLAIKIARATGDQQAEDSYSFQLEKRFPDSNETAALRQGKFK